MISSWSETDEKNSLKSFYRKLITVILQLNLNAKFQKLKLTSLAPQFSKLIINSALHLIRTQLINKVIYIANQTTTICNYVLHIVKFGAWIKFNNKRNLEKNCQRSLEPLTNWYFDETETMSNIIKAIAIPRNEILNKNPTENDEKLPLIVTFNRTIQDLRNIVNQNGHILQIDPKLEETLKKPPVVLFKRNKLTLLEIINFTNNKNLIHVKTFDNGKCHSCLTRTTNLCCKQVFSTT